MQRRVHPVIVVLALLVALVVAAMYGSRELGPPREGGPISAMEMRGGVPSPVHNPVLGAMWSPVPRRQGAMKIMGFRPPPGPPPGPAVGLRQNDILVACNGEPFRASDLNAAVKRLVEEGTPFTLTVERWGEKVTIEVTRWPEARVVADEEQPHLPGRPPLMVPAPGRGPEPRPGGP